MDVARASDAAGNVTVRLAPSGFPPSPGAVVHHDAHALHLRVERPIAAAGALLRRPAAVSSEEPEGGRAGRKGVFQRAASACRAVWGTWLNDAPANPAFR